MSQSGLRSHLLTSTPTGDAFAKQFGGDTSGSIPTETSDDPTEGRKTLTDLKKMFDDYRSTTSNNRLQRLVDIDYFHGNQLTPEEVSKLRQRGQPDIVVNRLRVAINGTLGVVVQSYSEPKCWGRNDQDEDSASVATDCLRYAVEQARWKRVKAEAAKDYLIPGTCAVLVGIDAKKRVTIAPIRWEEFFVDPRSRRPDCQDARYMGIAKWMFVEDASRMYPGKKDDLDNTMEGGSAQIGAIDESFQDRPVNQGWLDLRSKRCMVVEMYYREGPVWHKAVFFYGGVLEQGPSPFVDVDQNPTNPIIPQSCYVDRDNNRYGLVKDLRDLQDEINKRRQKLLHIVNNSQIQARDPSAIEVDADTAREEAARPDGVIPYGWEKVPMTDMAAGQQMLLTEAKSEMERFGPNPAILGRQGSDTSGRAVLARQQAGLVELADTLDQLQDWELRVYRAAWERIKQYWDEPQIIRVTDDPQSPKFIKINDPQPNPQAGQPMVDPQSGQAVVDPETGQPRVAPDVLGYKNPIAEMDVDINIDTTPATATILQEQFKDLMDLVSANPQYAQEVPFTLFLELMPGVPRKRQLIAKLDAYKQQVQQQNAEAQQKQAAASDAMLEAKLHEMASKGLLNTALANKATGDAHATAVRSETQATKALSDVQIASEEAAVHRYEIMQAADTAPVRKDAGEKGS